MIVSRLACALGAAVAAVLAPMQQTMAETLPPAVVAVIDTQFLLNNSAAGKDIRSQVEKFRAKYVAEIRDKETALRAENDELRRQQTILSPEILAEKQREFQEKVAALQEYSQKINRVVDEAIGRATGEVKNAVFVILGELRAEHGFNLVLDKSQVFLAFETLDLTQKVLERLNKRLSSIAVQMPVQE